MPGRDPYLDGLLALQLPGLNRSRVPLSARGGGLGSGVRSLGTPTPSLANHAWRHTFKARAERSGMSEKYSDAITGHTPPTAGRAYGKPIPEDLAEAVRKFPQYRL